ncbi:fatty acid-binding protein-like [Scylla paramamosain]|uniref:fatty acid-binding protein-like n=1 Tax=Scylla paramamosain TaxID=85552 RepID=UPI003083279E
MVQFNGTYKLEKNENLDEFLSKMDVGFMKRKLALSVKPTVVVEVEGDKWKLVTHTPASTVTWTFTLGAEVTLPTNDGREVRAVFTLEGDKLIQKTLSGKEAEVDNVREFTEDALIMLSVRWRPHRLRFCEAGRHDGGRGWLCCGCVAVWLCVAVYQGFSCAQPRWSS